MCRCRRRPTRRSEWWGRRLVRSRRSHTKAVRLIAVWLAQWIIAASLTSIAAQQPAHAACSSADDLTTSSALNCMVLVAVPDLPTARGAIELRPVPSTFGVSVTPDGRQRYRLVGTFDGLPQPRALGAFAVYVAWAYTLSLDSAVKLGQVKNGTTDRGEISIPQFRIFVTAERSVTVRERGSTLVLRGTSPSARLIAHRDVIQPSAPGALRDADTVARRPM